MNIKFKVLFFMAVLCWVGFLGLLALIWGMATGDVSAVVFGAIATVGCWAVLWHYGKGEGL